MKAWIAAGIALVGALVSSGAMADGNELADQCRVYTGLMNGEKLRDPMKDNPLKAGLCLGEVQGAVELMGYLGSGVSKDMKWCSPETASNDDAVRATIEYMSKNPDVMSKRKIDVIWLAMRDKWPCNE
ncbi:Rap1a/Tai family immunity protein [Pseudomonas sp. B21-048]|uniref:Rap1a/Tai family immunity protein n=1 Tax=Pseudomonas sp. B21-048 TaxID=2895490 RepID=UPI00215F1B78|nr:Rap1a/Tai family immunity protein [Pseudomonas sp. B21-048]UVK99869.1 hypothetical protein LOY56_05610 [Pseudomonas sp. B21-048]